MPEKRTSKKSAATKRKSPVARTPATAATKAATRSKTVAPPERQVTAPAASTALDAWLRFERRDRPVARLRAQAALYFRLQKREVLTPVLDTFHTWLAWSGTDRYEWFRRHDRVDCEPVDSRTLARLKLYLEGVRRDTRGVQLMHMDPSEEDFTLVLAQARACQMNVRVSERGDYAFSSHASLLRMIIPPDELTQQPSRVRDLVLQACDAIPVQCGIVGYVLAEGLELRGSRNADVLRGVTDAMRRFPVVDVQEDFASLLVPADRIKYVGWLTVLGEKAVERLGGETKLRRQLGNAIEFHSTRHALVIQTEATPGLHDTSADLLAVYREVYKAALPLLEPLAKIAPQEMRPLLTRLA
jgi:hypothetical protein